jgi:hypothetical protein
VSINVTRLEALRDKRKAAQHESWRPPMIEDFAAHAGTTRILAVDQSLSATGMVWLAVGKRQLTVYQAWTFRSEAGEDADGHEQNLQRAMNLGTQIDDVFREVYRNVTYVAHEGPPVGGGRILRPESSLLAALALRHAAARWGMPIASMVQPQAHKRVVCGNGNATKREEHAGLAQLATSLPIIGYSLVTNEATRDALCVGIAHLLRKGK